MRGALDAYPGQPARDFFLTTNHVVAETITLIRTTPPRSHAAAVRAGERLYEESFARVYWAPAEDERAAFAYFKQYADKEYSFVVPPALI